MYNEHKDGEIMYIWDENKNQANIKKHGVSFEEAQDVFDDVYSKMIADVEHSYNEERFIILGKSKASNLLVVCHCYKEDGNVVRIISARKANKPETKWYLGGVLYEE